MSGLNSKILKAQLLILFLLTAVSFFAFYFHDSLPDNFMSISSEENGVGFFSYYGSSLISFVGYYSGPWVFFPFISFSILYTFFFSRRDFKLDILNAFLLCGFFLSSSMLIYPRFLGDGLFYLFGSFLNQSDVIFLSLFFLVSSLACSFRGGFRDAMISIMNLAKNLPGILNRSWHVWSSLCDRMVNRTRSMSDLVKKKIPSRLSGQLEWKKSKVDPTSAYAQSVNPSPVREKVEIQKPIQNFEETKSAYKKEESEIKESVKKSLPKARPMRSANGEQLEMNYFAAVSTVSMKRDNQKNIQPDSEYFSDIISRIVNTLEEFKIDGEIINILKGPVVDTFELKLGVGVKVSKVTNTQKELSMALLGAPIRIVYPMIGKQTVGIEVPRNPREIIYLDEVLNTQEFKDSNLKLPIAMGKNAYGDTFVVDLAAMPHMLVAGATGAGKSVFINALLVSLLVKKSPEQMKLILIDPKQLELAVYSKLPHLIMPVLTDAKSAAIALMWAVQEMERRYTILKEFGVRNIEGFNEKLKRADGDMLANIKQYYEDDGEVYELPYLVIIVDEFADLILTKAGKEIECNINRLAAKARAAGIHLVLATQRPSVDVITGTIKSNFPTRVSFRVTASQDSRTILNTVGAEMLLGKGDMLFKQGAQSIRCHSSFVDEEEIEVLTEKLSEIPTDFKTQAMDYLENGGDTEVQDEYAYGSHIASNNDSDVKDKNLFDEAVRVVAEHQSASASMLQRRLRVGYNRAANLIEEMEAKGIVGPAEGSKRRKVLIPPMGN
jgi:S-DNA-T family DNA segregation ATPase FtsK/SpoIIIE